MTIACVRPRAGEDVMDTIAAAMEPFHDSWELPEGSSGWRAWNPLEPQAALGIAAAHDVQAKDLAPFEAVWAASSVGPDVLWCGGGRREQLDLESHRAALAGNARETWDLWQTLVGAQSPAEPSTLFFERHLSDPVGYPLERAVADFERQPLVAAARSVPPPTLADYRPGVPPAKQHRQLRFGFPRQHDLLQHFTQDADAFVEVERRRALPTEALLTVDGSWVEEPYDDDDEGCGVGKECFDMTARQEYCAFVDEYLLALPPDAVIALLSCRV